MTPPSDSVLVPVVKPLGQLGRYELLSLLAKGGMGEVYLARARGLGGFEKLVVIKRALPSLTNDTAPLLAEARLVATLQHTNIVQVYDVESDGPTVFIAMEFLHGQDVRALVKRGQQHRVPFDQAIAIALATCAGLHYAHEKRDADGTPLELVHRDVSPSNVFVTYDGGVKLIDFGIAKATTLPSETQLGTIKGKPGYMSPEQCKGEHLDRRTDIFCVGIMLYEMTLGRRPFIADNEYLLYKEICEATPIAPRAIDPDYPPALEAIVLEALAKDRRERPPTAADLQHRLAEVASVLRLDVSQFALGRHMDQLFHAELESWRQAQRSGQSLVEHVLKTTASVPALDISIVDAAPARSTVTTSTTTAASTPRKRSRAAIYALAGAAVAIGVAATIAVRARGSSPDESPPRVVEPQPALVEPKPALTEPARVEVDAAPAPIEPPDQAADAEPDAPKVETAKVETPVEKPKPKPKPKPKAKPAAGSGDEVDPEKPIR